MGNKRVDVLYEREGKRRLIDVAITFPLQPSSISKAAETEGGAATKYEAVKRAAYGPAIAAEAPEQHDLMLIPMVVDTFGAWGESALPELRALVSAVHRRHDWETYASVSHLAFHRLSFAVARAMARIALMNADVHLDAPEEEGQGDPLILDDSSSSSSSSGGNRGGQGNGEAGGGHDGPGQDPQNEGHGPPAPGPGPPFNQRPQDGGALKGKTPRWD
ncbi:hypothetical protein DIPPA_01257 [Diplonema papillatum]|nr:hypothetical protein DIPPA_01257 [Diplonema papillatum]